MGVQVLFISLLVLLAINVPILAALSGASLLAAFVSDAAPIALIQRFFTSIDSFPLLAVPFFMFSGSVMLVGGVSKRLVNLISVFFEKFPGNLGIITIVSCTFFGAISGSAAATVAAIGGIMYPAMINAGYDKPFALATIATGGCLGPIIPPSVIMVTYGVATNASIGSLFLIGTFPGLILCLAYSAYCYYYGKKHGYYNREPVYSIMPLKGKLIIVWKAVPALLMPGIILGGIYGGIFTPTEAGNVACVYGLIIGIFVYKELKKEHISIIIRDTVINSSLVIIIMGAAGAFGSIMTKFQIPLFIAEFVISVAGSRFVFLLILSILLLIVGCFMEPNAAIIIIAPLMLPIANAFGIDILFLGIIMVLNLVFGLLTPPVGINLYVACGIGSCGMMDILKKPLFVYITISIGLLFLFTYAPNVTMLMYNLFLK